jgi:preprotein translocase subunit YajC
MLSGLIFAVFCFALIFQEKKNETKMEKWLSSWWLATLHSS